MPVCRVARGRAARRQRDASTAFLDPRWTRAATSRSTRRRSSATMSCRSGSARSTGGNGLLRLDAGGNSYSEKYRQHDHHATLIAAYGLHLGRAELEFGASLPLAIMNGNRGPGIPATPGTNDGKTFGLDGQGLWQHRASPEDRLLRTGRGAHNRARGDRERLPPTIESEESLPGRDPAGPAAGRRARQGVRAASSACGSR